LAAARPFLKWAGGKRQLLPELMKRVAAATPFRRYHEPLVGGGALFFELVRQKRVDRRRAYLSDNNPNLTYTYLSIKQDVDRVIELLRLHEERNSESYYYEVRSNVPTDLYERAARIIYLNKTCYNGLYRENQKGEFNTPYGRYKNPTICDEDNLRAVADALKKATIECRSFETVLDRAEPADLVYFDPPYHPVSTTASFTAYDKGGFGEESQRRLAEVVAQLTDNGVNAIVSNSWTPFVRDLYKDFEIDRVLANRAVNSRADRRGKVSEALIRNF